ncbi:MAG: dCTP deaminase [Methylovirgula sp.]
MVLTDREIEQALSQKQIIIEPSPNLEEALSSTSLDLTLSNRFSTWKNSPGISISPGAKDYDYQNMVLSLQDHHTSGAFTLKSKHFVLAWTHEEVILPFESRIAARVEGKSSLARLGVSVHVTAPTIHSGFQGPIQLEMYNFGCLDIILTPGMRVCQLIFEGTFGTPAKGYKGQFWGQKPPGKQTA